MKANEIPNRVHFVGICGAGQSALALHLARTGHIVDGSDVQSGTVAARLASCGITVNVGHDEKYVQGAELVVRSSAVAESNPEVAYAVKKGIPVVLREQLLGAVVNDFRTRIAISGTHGKTTTTAWVHHVLTRCGVEHAAFIGGEYSGSNYYYGTDIVVCEACEYNKSFLNIAPNVAVCLNAEFDHPDCYADKAAVLAAFGEFVSLAKQHVAVLPVSLAYMAQGKAVLFGEGGDVEAKNVSVCCGKPSFDLVVRGQKVARCRLAVHGRHNVDNALAVVAVACALDLPLLSVATALGTFGGVQRRWTEYDGKCKVVVDYAHHPTEIKATVDTARSMFNNTVCVFQPHTFSRTKTLFVQFAECFCGVTVVYLPVFAAREKPLSGVNSQALASYARSIGVDAYYADNFAQAAALAKKLAHGGAVLLLGAGDVADMLPLLVDE